MQVTGQEVVANSQDPSSLFVTLDNFRNVYFLFCIKNKLQTGLLADFEQSWFWIGVREAEQQTPLTSQALHPRSRP